jgi:hypothetical protein
MGYTMSLFIGLHMPRCCGVASLMRRSITRSILTHTTIERHMKEFGPLPYIYNHGVCGCQVLNGIYNKKAERLMYVPPRVL